jgi:hypothetical protein
LFACPRSCPEHRRAGICAVKFCDPEPLPAANYGEARGAESRADFIHKLKVVFKELNETTIWLEVIVQSGQVSDEAIVAILTENRELCRIIAASIKTARAATE